MNVFNHTYTHTHDKEVYKPKELYLGRGHFIWDDPCNNKKKVWFQQQQQRKRKRKRKVSKHSKKIPFSALINKSDHQYCRHNKDANRSKHVNHLEFKYSVMQMMCLCVCVNQVSSSLSWSSESGKKIHITIQYIWIENGKIAKKKK